MYIFCRCLTMWQLYTCIVESIFPLSWYDIPALKLLVTSCYDCIIAGAQVLHFWKLRMLECKILQIYRRSKIFFLRDSWIGARLIDLNVWKFLSVFFFFLKNSNKSEFFSNLMIYIWRLSLKIFLNVFFQKFNWNLEKNKFCWRNF